MPNLNDANKVAHALKTMVEQSGKLQLLHKLLPRLRSEGRKLLIFSQMKRMLDLLEDYLALSALPYERLDGSVQQKERQAAIDRFQTGGPSEAFAFLLTTKAGGVGINLTAADTVIIFDSDWNPRMICRGWRDAIASARRTKSVCTACSPATRRRCTLEERQRDGEPLCHPTLSQSRVLQARPRRRPTASPATTTTTTKRRMRMVNPTMRGLQLRSCLK